MPLLLHYIIIYIIGQQPKRECKILKIINKLQIDLSNKEITLQEMDTQI